MWIGCFRLQCDTRCDSEQSRQAAHYKFSSSVAQYAADPEPARIYLNHNVAWEVGCHTEAPILAGDRSYTFSKDEELKSQKV